MGDFELAELPTPPPQPLEDELVMVQTLEEELFRIAALPPLWDPLTKNLLFVPLISAGMAIMFFDGPWIAALLAFPLGMVPGVLQLVKDKTNPLFGYLFELFTCVIVGFLAAVIVGTGLFPGVCFGTLGLAGIVWLIPGLPLVLSVMELITHSASAGASRLIQSVGLVILMGFGLDAGLLLANFLPLPVLPTNDCVPAAVDPLYYLLLFPFVAALHCAMMECTFPSHYLLSIPPAGVAFALWVGLQRIPWIQHAGTNGFGLVVLLSTFGGSLPGFLYARFTRRSAFVVVYVALQFVVPGAVSMKASLSGFNSRAGFAGPEFAARVMAGVLGCTVGAFAAHIVVWPFKDDPRERWMYLPYR
ncbi:hypothetical protein DFJ74DRAFT_694398 [Hyaloraphidium curvatum]|nr:hypothetical protein DFJ74DRAFT_694398 [Hyaloraphidium curvatum]